MTANHACGSAVSRRARSRDSAHGYRPRRRALAHCTTHSLVLFLRHLHYIISRLGGYAAAPRRLAGSWKPGTFGQEEQRERAETRRTPPPRPPPPPPPPPPTPDPPPSISAPPCRRVYEEHDSALPLGLVATIAETRRRGARARHDLRAQNSFLISRSCPRRRASVHDGRDVERPGSGGGQDFVMRLAWRAARAGRGLTGVSPARWGRYAR